MKKVKLTCIVDDDPIFVFGIKKLMEYTGFSEKLLVYTNGKEALDSLSAMIENNENLPDLILLDIDMPVMDGWEFLDMFKNLTPKTKIVIYIITSSIAREDIERAKRISIVSNYVVKPITPKDLNTILQNVKDARE